MLSSAWTKTPCCPPQRFVLHAFVYIWRRALLLIYSGDVQASAVFLMVLGLCPTTLPLHHWKPDAEFELPIVPKIAMAQKRNIESQTLSTLTVLPSTQREREHKQIRKERRSQLETKHQPTCREARNFLFVCQRMSLLQNKYQPKWKNHPSASGEVVHVCDFVCLCVSLCVRWILPSPSGRAFQSGS